MRINSITLTLFLAAVSVLVWIAWPRGGESDPHVGAGQQGPDVTDSDPLHAHDKEAAASGTAIQTAIQTATHTGGPRLLGVRRDSTAKNDPDAGRSAVEILIDELSSRDVDVRRAAAQRMVDAGVCEVRHVAQLGASLDAKSWREFRDAVIGDKSSRRSLTCALVAAAHAAPEAHRNRLIALAQRLEPDVGATRTQQEIEALVWHELVELCDYCTRGAYTFGYAVAIYGHAGVAPTLEILRNVDPDKVDRSEARNLLTVIAQPEDIPALRELLLQGEWSVAYALGRLDALGFEKASDALIEVIRKGRFDRRIAAAIRETSNPSRMTHVVRKWLHKLGRDMTESEFRVITGAFVDFKSRADIAVLEAWRSPFGDHEALALKGMALARLGSVKGVDMLVRVMVEKAQPRSLLLSPEGASRPILGRDHQERRRLGRRRDALGILNAMALLSSDSENDAGPWPSDLYNDKDDMEEAAPEVRAWWEKSRARIEFDENAWTWRFKSD